MSKETNVGQHFLFLIKRPKLGQETKKKSNAQHNVKWLHDLKKPLPFFVRNVSRWFMSKYLLLVLRLIIR